MPRRGSLIAPVRLCGSGARLFRRRPALGCRARLSTAVHGQERGKTATASRNLSTPIPALTALVRTRGVPSARIPRHELRLPLFLWVYLGQVLVRVGGVAAPFLWVYLGQVLIHVGGAAAPFLWVYLEQVLVRVEGMGQEGRGSGGGFAPSKQAKKRLRIMALGWLLQRLLLTMKATVL